MTPATQALLLQLIAHHAADLRQQHAVASRMFSPGHHQVGEIARAVIDAERAVNELRSVCERAVA